MCAAAFAVAVFAGRALAGRASVDAALPDAGLADAVFLAPGDFDLLAASGRLVVMAMFIPLGRV